MKRTSAKEVARINAIIDKGMPSPKELAKIKAKDIEQYSKTWDLIKKPMLENTAMLKTIGILGDRKTEPYKYNCLGLVLGKNSHNNFEAFNALVEFYKSAESFKLPLLFRILEEVISELEQHTGSEYTWILNDFYEHLKTRCDKANKRIATGFLTFLLVENGVSKRESRMFISKWLKVSPTHVRDSFIEINKHIKNNKRVRTLLGLWEFGIYNVIANGFKSLPTEGFAKSKLALEEIKKELSNDPMVSDYLDFVKQKAP